MIKKYLLMFIFLVSLLGCKPKVDEGFYWSQSEKNNIPEIQLFKVSNIHSFSKMISPDGHWFLSLISDSTMTKIRVTSIIDPTIYFDSMPIVGNLSINSWSPDSSSVLLTRAIIPEAPCNDKDILIIQIPKTGGLLKSNFFSPKSDSNYSCVQASWSPESDLLAITFDKSQIFVIDIEGDVIEKIPLNLSDKSSLPNLNWIKRGLLVSYSYYSDVNPEIRERWQLFTINEKNKPILVYDKNSIQDFLGANDDSSKILLGTNSEGYEQSLLILPISNKENEHTISISGNFCKSSTSSDFHFTAIQIARPNEPCGGITDLWIFDWKSEEIINMGVVVDLLGWRDDELGFAVITGNEKEGYRNSLLKLSQN
jgi:hypothetical protein